MARWLLIAVALCSPSLALAQSAGISRAYCVTHLERAELVAPDTGWLIVHESISDRPFGSNCTTRPRLYWTDTNGQDWREISPPGMPAGDDPLVFFLDSAHGWVLSSDRPEEEGGKFSYLFFTADAGKSWQSARTEWPRMPVLEYTRPLQVFFSDSKHGWILWGWHMTHSYQHALSATEDRGVNWKQLPQPPGSGPMQFISPVKGWIIGEPREAEGIPVPQAENLWATGDGGLHWRAIGIPLPSVPAPRAEADSEAGADAAAEPGPPFLTAFRFSDRRHGVVAAERQISGREFQVFTCVTGNGGKTWRFTSFEAYHATPSFSEHHVVWSTSDWPARKLTLRFEQRLESPESVDGAPLAGSFRDVHFIEEYQGWTIYDHEERSDLVATSDGGKSFRVISPPEVLHAPLPPPSIAAVNRRSLLMVRLGPEGLAAPRLTPGGVLMLFGNGFLAENTLRIGSRALQVPARSAKGLRCFLPADLPAGRFPLTIENARGLSNAVEVEVGSPLQLLIRQIRSGSSPRSAQQRFHPGQIIWITGSGFLLENTVWFGTQAVPAQLPGHGFNVLHLTVPANLPPGDCDVYFSNASGQSNVFQIHIE